jgi:hypothetical protein
MFVVCFRRLYLFVCLFTPDLDDSQPSELYMAP